MMPNNTNENDITQQSIISPERKANEVFFLFKGNKKEEIKKGEIPKNYSTGNLINDIAINNNSLFNNNELIYSKYNIINQSKENKNKSKERKNIFKVNYRNIHDGDALDNIKQIIVTNFVNFFLIFINFIINQKINEESIKFQIGYQLKNKIKLEDILLLTVEKLLTFEPHSKKKILIIII